MKEIEENENDSETMPADKSEELEKYKQLNAELEITLAKVQKQKALAKRENKLCTANYKGKLKKIHELENQLEKSNKINEEHLLNLRAQMELATIKKSDFNAGKIKPDILLTKLLTDVSSVSTSNSNMEIQSSTKSNDSAASRIFTKLTPSKHRDNVIVNNRKKDKIKMVEVVAANVNVADTVESSIERSIVSEKETSTSASICHKRSTRGIVCYVEPKLGTKLRRPRI